MGMESVKPNAEKELNIEDLLEILNLLRMSNILTDSKDISNKEMVLGWLKDFLKSHNLSPKKIISAWSSNANSQPVDEKEMYTKEEAREDLISIVTKNVSCIQNIERKYSGISKYLNENYGIQNFGRFSKEAWLDQYEEREQSKPFGLVVISRDDWNGSSYNDNAYETYEDLRIKLKPNHSLKIIEAKSIPELAKLLVGIERKHKRIPEFVVWSGHGGQEFSLGPSLYRKQNYKFSIAKEDFQDSAAERMRPYLNLFSKDTIMILDGCNDDESNDNLVSVAAKAIGNRFIYPKGKTSVKNFGVKKDPSGKLSFDVKYNFGIKAAVAEGQTKIG